MIVCTLKCTLTSMFDNSIQKSNETTEAGLIGSGQCQDKPCPDKTQPKIIQNMYN